MTGASNATSCDLGGRKTWRTPSQDENPGELLLVEQIPRRRTLCLSTIYAHMSLRSRCCVGMKTDRGSSPDRNHRPKNSSNATAAMRNQRDSRKPVPRVGSVCQSVALGCGGRQEDDRQHNAKEVVASDRYYPDSAHAKPRCRPRRSGRSRTQASMFANSYSRDREPPISPLSGDRRGTAQSETTPGHKMREMPSPGRPP